MREFNETIKQFIETLNKVNQLFSFIDELPKCDNCGEPTLYKSLRSPFHGSEIWICQKCWDEFMTQS